jgi:hypothetical protein
MVELYLHSPIRLDSVLSLNYPSIIFGRLKKITKSSFVIASLHAEISTQNLLNMRRQYCSLGGGIRPKMNRRCEMNADEER